MKRVGWDARPGDMIALPECGNWRVIHTFPNCLTAEDKDGNRKTFPYRLLYELNATYAAQVVVPLPDLKF